MRHFILIIEFSLLLLISVSAQNNIQITWQDCYGGGEIEWVDDLIETDDGNYFVLGTTYSQNSSINNHGESDIWLVKIDSLGNLLWQRCYGGSDIDFANNIIKDNQGYYYFGGAVFSTDGDVQSTNHGGYDRWIVKINNQGDIIWEKCFGGSGTEYACQLVLLNDGNILVHGATASGDGDVPINYGFLDIWLMKITPDGDILESQVYGNQLHNNVFSVIETSDGGYFFAGKTECVGGMVQGDYKGDVDVWVVKLDPQFNIEWQKLYGGTYEDYGLSGVLEMDDGFLFLAGITSNDMDVTGYHGSLGDISGSDIWAVRIDSIGNIQWQKCLGGSQFESTGVLNFAEDGGYLIIGETQSNNGDVSGNHSYPNWGWSDIWMVKLSSEGELEWQECIGGMGNERIHNGVIKKKVNNWIFAGRASYNSDDVNCNLHGEYIEDFWVFEIKDCSLYMPAIPDIPAGTDTVCTTNNLESTYSTSTAAGAWSYEWKLEPDTAGIIAGDSLLGIVMWSPVFEGLVTITVRSTNDCGYSEWSQPYYTQVNTCLGSGEHCMEQFKVYPNPAGEYVVFEFRDRSSEFEAGELIITDVFGQKVAEIEVKGVKKVWDIRKVQQGVYFYRIKAGFHSVSGKLIIE